MSSFLGVTLGLYILNINSFRFKPSDLAVLHSILIRMQFDVVWKKGRLDILKLLLSWNICSQGKWLLFLNWNHGLHSNVYHPIWFKCGLMVETVQLCVAMLIDDLDLDLRPQSCRKAKYLFKNCVTKFSFDLFRWNMMCCWNFLVWCTTYSFYVVWSVFMEVSSTLVFSWNKTKILTLTWRFTNILF